MPSKAEERVLDREQPFKLGIENRFPLDLTATPTSTWDAYEHSLLESWDPEDETLWAGFDPESIEAKDRQAGALVWSHRVWVDFTAIAESEAVLVRVCLEPGVTADFKYCLSMRAVERARSTDLAHLLATRLGRYQPSPATPELAALLDGELVRRALHDDADIDAYIAAHLVAQATVDLRMWEQSATSASSPIAALIGHVVRDKVRMIEVAWQYLAGIMPDASQEKRATVAEEVTAVLGEEEARGRQVPALLGDSADRRQLLAAHARVAAAGLGGVTPAEQLTVFSTAVADVASRLAEFGVVIESPAVPQP